LRQVIFAPAIDHTSGPIEYRAVDEDGTDTEQQDGGRVMDRAHREAASKSIAKEDHGRIGREHAAGSAGDDGRKVRITGGKRDRCNLGFIADFRDEKCD
jgi:hypothetical protein